MYQYGHISETFTFKLNNMMTIKPSTSSSENLCSTCLADAVDFPPYLDDGQDPDETKQVEESHTDEDNVDVKEGDDTLVGANQKNNSSQQPYKPKYVNRNRNIAPVTYAVYDHEQSQDDVNHGPHLQTSRCEATGAALAATGIYMRRSLLNYHNLWLRLVA